MKKHIGKYHLGRDTTARKALFKGLVESLIQKEEIKTTDAKAKAVRSIFEKLVTKAKVGSIHARRQVHSFVQKGDLVKKLVDEIAPRYVATRGGYTHITILGNRKGDNAKIVRLSLTKKAEVATSSKKAKAKKTVISKSPRKSTVVPSIVDSQKVKQAKQIKSTPTAGMRKGER